MQMIIPHLWFDKEASEAAGWYVSLFKNSGIINVATLPDTPSGDAELVDFKLANLRMMAISAGPYFKFNPSISLMVACCDEEEVNRLYGQLSMGGTDLMPLGEYPFSKRYAWVQDRYGLSWQLILAEGTEGMEEHQKIRPSLLFSKNACGKAENAIDYYVSIFKESEKGFTNHYAVGEAADARAKINYAEFMIGETQLVAMDNGLGGDFDFNEAFSLMVMCENQEEIDYYWNKLSFVPEAEQCGWVKDQFGLSWQISAVNMDDVFMKGSGEEINRVMQAVLKMKKFDLSELEKARRGEM